MARCARIISSTDTYHVILRGVNKQTIFSDETDYHYFIETLLFYKDICKYDIYAYCLMRNHIHLLIHFDKVNISNSIKNIADKYAWWYNNRHSRSGHLFQERFKSEPIEDEQYLLTAFRYIIQNPMKAGIEPVPGTYPWSCFQEYLTNSADLTNIEFMKRFFHNSDDLIQYLTETNYDYCMENESIRKNDQLALSLIQGISGCQSMKEFQQLSPLEHKRYITLFWKLGMSFTQISRLTGLSRVLIQKILESD